MMYNVGQVLYLLTKKGNKIVPARIESVVTVKRVSGEEITHEISVPGAEDTVQLEKLKVEVFTAPADLRSHLLNILVGQVDAELDNISETVVNTWGEQTPRDYTAPFEPSRSLPPAEPEQAIFQPEELSETVQVELENGIKARVHLPKEMT